MGYLNRYVSLYLTIQIITVYFAFSLCFPYLVFTVDLFLVPLALQCINKSDKIALLIATTIVSIKAFWEISLLLPSILRGILPSLVYEQRFIVFTQNLFPLFAFTYLVGFSILMPILYIVLTKVINIKERFPWLLE